MLSHYLHFITTQALIRSPVRPRPWHDREKQQLATNQTEATFDGAGNVTFTNRRSGSSVGGIREVVGVSFRTSSRLHLTLS